MNLKRINWDGLKRYANPQAVKDLDAFLDTLPANVGVSTMAAAAFAWALAIGAIFFASHQVERASQIRADLMQVEALKPPIPVLKYVPVSQNVLKPLSEKISATYRDIVIAPSGDGAMTLSARDTDFFPQFTAAIGYLQRGGKNWKVKINALCVGQDCKGQKLTASLAVESVRFGDPGAEVKKDTPVTKAGQAIKDAERKK